MTTSQTRLAIGAIWGVIAAVAIVQATVWTIAGGAPRAPAELAEVLLAWAVMLSLAGFSTWLILRLARTLVQRTDAHLATLDEFEQLQMQNAMLQIIARSVDVPLAFQALAQRVSRLVPCDRVGLALVSESGTDLQTYTARVNEDERRARPRPEVVFKTDRTVLGKVVRSREPLLIDDTRSEAHEFLDVNVLHTAGFRSALLVPLVSKGRSVGTLNVVSRKPRAFTPAHAQTLLPVAEIFAVAYVAQQLHMSLGKYRSMEMMSELTLSIATEINSALQIIVGHCDLLQREYPDQNLQRDLTTVIEQARRVARLIEEMRAAARQRLKEVADSVHQSGIPSSPEAFDEKMTS